MESTIGCVIVTFNRLDKLRKTLISYANQILKPKFIVVVDNASTDQTAQFLNQWEVVNEGFQKIVIHSKKNIGGSGGFYLGEIKALELDSDWIMIADDDAYPQEDYLWGMQKYINENKNDKISIICGKVEENGNYVNLHRSVWKNKWDRNFHIPVKKEEYSNKEFHPDFVSYVGIVINKDKLKTAGIVDKNNFIWCDDTEHTYRLSQKGKIVCLPSFTIVHDVDSTNDSLSWKYYYGYRNDLIFFRKHFKSRFPFIVAKLMVKTLFCPLHGKSFEEVKLRLHAIHDAIFGKMGIDNKYKPGWKNK